jgi:hypothetical protein
MNRRFVVAMSAYAALAAAAFFRLDGKPRIVVLLVLGLFAVRTWLVVLKLRVD